MKVELDRREGEFAVLLFDGLEVVVPQAWLPNDTDEGSGLIVTIEKDRDSTTSERVDSALSRLTEDDVSGEGIEL